VADRADIPDYWGYSIKVERRSLKCAVEGAGADLVLGTSRKGIAFAEVADVLGRRWKDASGILVIFGSPARGLPEIARDEGVRLDTLVDYMVNTVPCQGTETVRTEEALLATLAVLNVKFNR